MAASSRGRETQPEVWWGTELLNHDPDTAVWARARRTVTLGELRAEVAWLQRLLGHHGISADTTVVLQGTPSFTLLWTLFALWSLGAQVMLVDPRLRGPAMRRAIAWCAPQYYIEFGRGRALAHFRDESEVMVQRLPSGKPARSAHCLVQLTSGTTGGTKTIGRTAESLLAELNTFSALDGMPVAGERVLLLDPVIHSLGLIGGVLHGLKAGVTTVFASNLQPREIARAAEDAAVHAIIGGPRHFDLLLSALPEPPPLPTLRLALSSGEALPRRVFDRFERRYRIRIGQAYGTTETGIIAADLAGLHGPAAIGRPVPGVDVRVAVGELHVRVTQSPYLDDTIRLLPGGWLRTYDLAVEDTATGVLTLRGRADPRAPWRDTQLDLADIEAVVGEYEQVTEAVVMRRDEIEVLVAGTDALRLSELTAWCRARLPRDHWPTRFRALPALPRTPNGKLVRNYELLVS